MMRRCEIGSASASSSATTSRYLLSNFSPAACRGNRRITALSNLGTIGAIADLGGRIPAILTDDGEVSVQAASALVVSTASPSLRAMSRARQLARLVPIRVIQR